MATMKSNGLGLAGMVGTLVTLGVVACGDDFSGDCKVNHTCPVSGEPDEQGGSNAAPTSGGADASDAAGTANGGTSATGAGGDGAGGDGAGGDGAGGDGAGGDGTGACTGPEDCDDGNPSDGEEICSDDGVCAPGNAPPTVTAISPDVDEDNVATDVAVVITFSEALDKATITSQSVQIIDGDKLIDGELSYAGDKVTFTPAEP
ncbi:MAG TPA: Ig-like domain-containing protein, partial [Polyangiaceae bacterium]|nr:Ig-like domain-containing protein [Polyangiaceae bacterium]